MKILFGLIRYLFLVLIVTTGVGAVVGGAIFIHFSRGLPNIIRIEDYKPNVVTKVYGRGDKVVGEFFKERRYLIPLDKIPDVVVKAFIAAEDDKFFDHSGIDFQGIVRAAIANFKAGRVVQGGSTITQQVAKSLLLSPERSYFRKMKEVILASRMERSLNKEQILFLYLNQIYLGQGAYGVEAAAQVYFNKTSAELNLAEASLLAGLPQAPSKYSPLKNPKPAKERQRYVLRRLFERGTISQKEMIEAEKEPIKIYFHKDLNNEYAPYYVEHIRKYLIEKYGGEKLYQSGLRVYTPMDPRLAKVAQKSVEEGLRKTDKRQGYRGPIRSNKTREEREEALNEVMEYNIAKKFPFKVLLENGEHSYDLEYRLGENQTDLDVYTEGELYKGVVSKVSDRDKKVTVQLGLIAGEITLKSMTWAQRVKAPSSKMVEPIRRPSEALRKGDMIWVRLVKLEPKDPEKKDKKKEEPGLPELVLEQEPLVQGALFSMDVMTGEVVAMVGGYSFKASEFNRAIQALRQPGSAFKPIIYSAAIEKGYTPSTIIQDSPIVFQAGEDEKWKPDNFSQRFYGDTIVRQALVKSRNIPTIKVVQDIEVPYVIEFSRRIGIHGNLNPDLSISLGSSIISLMDLSRIYAIYPRGGRTVEPIFIRRIEDRFGEVLEETPTIPEVPPMASNLPPPPKPVRVNGELQQNRVEVVNNTATEEGEEVPVSEESELNTPPVTTSWWTPDPNDPTRVMDPRTAYVMTHLMTEVATVGTGWRAKSLGRPAAGKTGTTNDNLDAWFMGFTPNIVAGAWVGFDNQKSLGSRATGGGTALPIWLGFMKEAVKSYPETEFAVPEGITFVYIDSKTGRPVSANRPGAIKEAFIAGTEPGSSLLTNRSEKSNWQDSNTAPGSDVRTEEFFKADIE